MPFDPFSDRTARDIRNSLSSALVGELTGLGGMTVAAIADDWLARQPADIYRAYLVAQTRRYVEILSELRADRIDTPRQQAVVLWNAGFYFELHELLETIWQGAAEPERTGLKGLIQAAGAYLHLGRGKQETAMRLAQRARHHLRTGSAALSFIANLEQLISALGDSPPTPVTLIPG